MSDYLLLQNPRQCPSCFAKFTNPLNGYCPNCGMRLFSNQNINFDRFEEDTNIAVWWAFDKTKGWMYRDHFMIPEAAPMAKRFELPEVPKDYGKQTTPDAVAARGGKITRHLKKEKMKVKPIKI